MLYEKDSFSTLVEVKFRQAKVLDKMLRLDRTRSIVV